MPGSKEAHQYGRLMSNSDTISCVGCIFRGRQSSPDGYFHLPVTKFLFCSYCLTWSSILYPDSKFTSINSSGFLCRWPGMRKIARFQPWKNACRVRYSTMFRTKQAMLFRTNKLPLIYLWQDICEALCQIITHRYQSSHCLIQISQLRAYCNSCREQCWLECCRQLAMTPATTRKPTLLQAVIVKAQYNKLWYNEMWEQTTFKFLVQPLQISR